MTQSILRCAVLIAGLAVLAACGAQHVAQIPASGVSGMNGGADDTLSHDRAGKALFRS